MFWAYNGWKRVRSKAGSLYAFATSLFASFILLYIFNQKTKRKNALVWSWGPGFDVTTHHIFIFILVV